MSNLDIVHNYIQRNVCNESKCDLFFACSINNYNFEFILHSGTNSDCWTQDINRILNISFQASACSIARIIDSTKSILLLIFTQNRYLCWMFDLNELFESCIVIDIRNKPTPLLFYLACQAVIASLKFHYIWICIDIVYSTVDVELGFLQ